MPHLLTRAEFATLLKSGRKLVWAGLYERQDFIVQLTPSLARPVRDVTDEPNHHTRPLIGAK